jgi:hypothetical protein
MSDYDRGPYTPSPEAPLAFDPRRLDPPRGAGPAPLTLIVSIVLLLAVIGGGFFLYRSGARAPGAAPQPVGAPMRDVRMPPPPQPQEADPAAGLSIYKDDPNAPPAAPAFVAPPEQPTPRPVAGAATAGPAAPRPQPSALAAAAPRTPPPPAKSVPAAPKLAAAQAPAPDKAGAAVVQIGAYSSAALADAGWNEDARVAPGVMAGKNKKVDVVSRGGATLYRAAITGFPSRFEAQALCDKLKAAGKTCFVR